MPLGLCLDGHDGDGGRGLRHACLHGDDAYVDVLHGDHGVHGNADRGHPFFSLQGNHDGDPYVGHDLSGRRGRI